MKAVNLDVFTDVAGQFTVGGVAHDVLHLNGAEYRTLNGEIQTVLVVFAIAARIVPSLGEDVYQLTAKQVGAIIAIADGRVTEVEAQFPNGDGASATNESPAPPV